MKLRTLGTFGLVAGLAFASFPAGAQQAATPPATAPAPAAAATPAAPVKLSLSNKWRIEVSEGTHRAGVLVFRVTPKDGTPTDVTVSIKDGRGENEIAKDIVKTLKEKLDSKIYKVERDDGEDVLVKKRKGPDYEVKLLENTLSGTRVSVEKE